MKTLLLSMFTAGALNAVAGFSIDQNLMTAVGAFIGTITLTVAVVTWIDKRIAKQVKPLSDQIEEIRAAVMGEPKRPPEKRR